MDRTTTANRLKQVIQEQNLRQIDLLEKCEPLCKKYGVKINKSDLSQYLSGKVTPGQEKLTVLGMALGVNETWLMGFDVYKDRHNVERLQQYTIKFADLVQRNELMKAFETLNNCGKKVAIERIKELAEIPVYKNEQELKAAHAIEGATEEDIKHDDDIMDDDNFQSVKSDI